MLVLESVLRRKGHTFFLPLPGMGIYWLVLEKSFWVTRVKSTSWQDRARSSQGGGAAPAWPEETVREKYNSVVCKLPVLRITLFIRS